MIHFVHHLLTHFVHQHGLGVGRFVIFAVIPLVAFGFDAMLIAVMYRGGRLPRWLSNCLCSWLRDHGKIPGDVDEFGLMINDIYLETQDSGLRFRLVFDCSSGSDKRFGLIYKEGLFLSTAFRPPFAHDFWVCQWIFSPQRLPRPLPKRPVPT